MHKIVISFDTTGSMSPAIAEVRRRVEDTVHKLFDTYGNDLQMCLLAHGDYLDARDTYDVIHTGFTSDPTLLIEFVRNVKNTNGYSSRECYEKVLKVVSELDWRDATSRALVMFGDAEPHVRGHVTDRDIICPYDWREELNAVADRNISVYAVQCLGRGSSFWKTLGETNQGAYVTLDQFAHVNELLLAISHRENGTLEMYADNLKNSGLLLNRGVATFIAQLTGKAIAGSSLGTVKTREGLIPVAPGRFQVLHVDARVPIKAFVEATGAVFRTGRGFYELTKSETVQEYKETVLVDKTTGDMLTGREARELIGLPYGSRGTVKPLRGFAYDVYIQSTSYNRVLIPGTRFLYEKE